MFTVKAVSENSGKPLKGTKVFISWPGIFGTWSEEFTDEHGDAHFDLDPGTGEIYLDGTSKFKGYISGRVVLYL